MSSETSAAKLVIAFEGLMMFHTEGKDTHHVVIIEDREHRAHRASIDICSFAGDDQLKHRLRGFRKGDRVTFGGVTGAVRPDELFRRHVPQLATFVRQGQIRQDLVQSARASTGVLATIELPPGNLTTWGTLPERVAFQTASGETAAFCFARFSVLQADIELPVKVAIQRAGRRDEIRRVNAGEIVIVSNSSTSREGRHFHLYEQLLASDGKLGQFAGAETGACDEDEGTGRLGEPVETILRVARTEMPRTPNGDCGQVSNLSGGG